MALSMKMMLNMASRNIKNYWISRKNDDDTYSNVDIKSAQSGDVIWFSVESTDEEAMEAIKTLESLNLHTYSCTLDKNHEQYTGKPMKSKTGAVQYLILDKL
tara:strand:- start:941 stop:1246 length:306 start_codon:yes stop_codon:yes gene_type:complete